METLLLSANNLGDNGAKAISRCLQNIKTLTISKCNLSEEGVTCLRMANANIDQVMFSNSLFLCNISSDYAFHSRA